MHPSRSKENREITFYDLARLSDEECWNIFKVCRFGEDNKFACPECNIVEKHWFIKTRRQWHCKHCNHRFSVTSGTTFHNRKLSLSKLLCLILHYINGLQGANANREMSELGITYRTAFLNLSKIREVVFETMDLTPLSGTVHIDCMHICGKPRRSNIRKSTDSSIVNNKLRSRKDSIVPDLKTHPEPSNLKKLENRRIILAFSQVKMHEGKAFGSDRTITYVIKNENSKTILPLIKQAVSKYATVMTDFGGAFNKIEPLLGIKHFAVNHSMQYQDKNGTNNNQAESFFSRIRRAEYGTYNAVSKTYLAFYAAEFANKNDTKYIGIKERLHSLLTKILSNEPSKAFCGYNQGHRLNFEYCTE